MLLIGVIGRYYATFSQKNSILKLIPELRPITSLSDILLQLFIPQVSQYKFRPVDLPNFS